MADPLGGMPIGPYGPGPTEQGMPGEFAPREPSKPGESFVDLLKSSINEVNTMQANAANKVQKLVTGEISSVHEVMIAGEEAGIAFSLLLQIRNQLLKAWDELKRTPV
ncbi:MAG: flagellar hook-basal body complex protein FliE [Candidatus Omnitrophota bacterium]|jgi:flagellar hook-basal body complex protein FliE|nr:MAG: flagellar hook-basal body complex protein FliE [Candidatus Omnitrophota bacterium]